MGFDKVRNALMELENEYKEEVRRNRLLKEQYRELEQKLKRIQSALKEVKALEEVEK